MYAHVFINNPRIITDNYFSEVKTNSVLLRKSMLLTVYFQVFESRLWMMYFHNKEGYQPYFVYLVPGVKFL